MLRWSLLNPCGQSGGSGFLRTYWWKFTLLYILLCWDPRGMGMGMAEELLATGGASVAAVALRCKHTKLNKKKTKGQREEQVNRAKLSSVYFLTNVAITRKWKIHSQSYNIIRCWQVCGIFYSRTRPGPDTKHWMEITVRVRGRQWPAQDRYRAVMVGRGWEGHCAHLQVGTTHRKSKTKELH